METIKLNQLKELLSIPTYFEHEELIQDYLIEYGKNKNYIVYQDDYGNVYFEKGKIDKNQHYPCVCAHMDTVYEEHIELIAKNKKKIIQELNNTLVAYNPLTGDRTGLGADDLAGVFISLQMMEKFDNIKAAFFVEEEYGCYGSKACDVNFFKNVGYVIQFDAPRFNYYTKTLSGVEMFDEKFDNEVKPILEKYSIDNYSDDSYTDVLILKQKFDFCCANLPTGYENWHSDTEFINIDDLDKSIKLGIDFITKLGLKKHKYKK